jgi:hypothetical protein
MPMKLNNAHPTMRWVYRILPLRKYGHPSFATRAGNMLQKAMIPLGVDGGTRSSAADRMITYKTGANYFGSYTRCKQIFVVLTFVDKPEEKKGDAELQELLLPACNVVNEHRVGDKERKMRQMESSSTFTHDWR